MMKRRLIAICFLAVFFLIIGSTAKANQILDVVDSSSGQPDTIFFPGGPTEGYLISGPDWGWTHTFSFEGPAPPEQIISATLAIKHFGVLMYDEHEIFLDGLSLGYLDNGFAYEQVHVTTFVLDQTDIDNLLDGTANMWIDIDWPNAVAVYSSTLTINYVPSGLINIIIDGPTQVDEDSTAQYTCTAHYIDSSTSDVTNSVTWTDNSEYASIDNGLLTTSLVTSDQPCQIKATLGSKTDTHDIIIKNVVPIVSMSSVTSTAAETGFNGLIDVTRTGSTKVELRVYYDTAGSTAISGDDYMALDGYVDIPVGESSVGIVINVIDDEIEEGPETVELKLTMDPSSYIIDPVSYSATVTIADDDGSPPDSSEHLPPKFSVQVARDTLIQLHITDDGIGIEDVTIHVGGDLIYDGSVDAYNTASTSQAVRGLCRRIGTATDYLYVFQPSTLFDYEQEVNVDINATDKAGRTYTDTYHFFTIMRTFGKNIKVNTGDDTLAQNNPATAMDSDGNIWVVWEHAIAAGDSDIYIGKLPAGGSAFETSQLIYSDPNDQRMPAIAIDGNDNLYVVWQGDDPNNLWDIFASTSTNGATWSAPVKVNSNDPLNKSNQTKPCIAVDGIGLIYVAWEDDFKGSTDKDIWVGTSLDATTWISLPIATAINNQTTPVIDILGGFTPYVFWTDARNTSDDIFASKNSGVWLESPIVDTPSDQSSPAVSINENGIIHLLWVDEDPQFIGFEDIFYGNNTQGLPISGISIVDQPGVRQDSPSIAANNEKVFACWRDLRNVSNNNDTDIYYTETTDSEFLEFGTNILVKDDIGTYTQMTPDIGINIEGNPYMVWVDNREGNNDIYATVSTSIGSVLVESEVDASFGATQIVQVDTTTDNIDSADDVRIEIPDGALPISTKIKIAELKNPPEPPSGAFGIFYEFGPSGLQFNLPVTVTIPHKASECPDHAEYRVYYYDPSIIGGFPWSEDGISNVKHLTSAEDPNLPADVHVVQFDTIHFTGFGVGGGAAGGSGGGVVGGGGGGGGGCAVSAAGECSVVEFMLPYIGFIIVLAILTVRDTRIKRSRN